MPKRTEAFAGVVVVTGGASGIGRACVDLFESNKWCVVALDIDGSALKGLGQGRSVMAKECDVTDVASVEQAVREVVEAVGAPTALVNAAGVYPPTDLWAATEDQYVTVFGTNVWATVVVSQSLSRYMAQVGRGAIVNLASDAAYVPSPDQLLYAASKAAVVSLTRSMAAALVSHGIRVNAVAPGWVETEGTRRGGRLDAGVQSVPMGRAAQPKEIADAIWWLTCGQGAQYITGETVLATGGLFIR